MKSRDELEFWRGLIGRVSLRKPAASVELSSSARRDGLAHRLRVLREACGLTRIEMGKLISRADPSCTEQQIWRYETGRARVSAELLLSFCEALDLPLSVTTTVHANAELEIRIHRLTSRQRSELLRYLRSLECRR